MSQPALSELKQRIGFQDGKAGIWMGIDISGFNMPPLGNQIPRRLATQLYIYIYNMFISHFYDCWRGNVGCQNAGNNCRYRWYSADWDWERYIEWNDDHGNGFLFNNPSIGSTFLGKQGSRCPFFVGIHDQVLDVSIHLSSFEALSTMQLLPSCVHYPRFVL